MEEGAPICRLHLAPDLTLDVMPQDPSVLGFSNRWYTEGARAAQQYKLPSGHLVKALSPLYFVATKLEAFRGRGGGDYLTSHDLEDVIAVLVAHPALLDELRHLTDEAGRYVREELRRLARDEDFITALPGCLPPDAESQTLAMPLINALRGLV